MRTVRIKLTHCRKRQKKKPTGRDDTDQPDPSEPLDATKGLDAAEEEAYGCSDDDEYRSASTMGRKQH
ncbi:hypothetical protein PHISCL_10769 [Aspergillus sclerotialis]|uniref:Uncharacterized protein n=1 Tax=Aspergillus sclerotialis TaxID=2070753 RepID=A0A3A2ZBX9_9EURO|nr:hypothetical protein PHISCL_10769 [Aspergillus sclerotialis]